MAEVLSQTEIDALLAAVSSGNVETIEPEASSGIDWIAYDLTSQEKIIRSRLVGLEGIHERFSRLFRVTLSNTLKKNVTVTASHTDFLKFGDYLTNIMLPASLNILSVPNLNGAMIFVASSKLTYALVDAYYGGSERPFSKIGGREEFTAIEKTMIRKICLLAVEDLREAWKLNYPIDLEFVRAESNPHFVGAIHTSEVVAVVNFEVELETLSGPLVLIVQLKSLEPIQQALSVNVTSETDGDHEVWERHWFEELRQMDVDVRVEVGNMDTTLGHLQSLKKDDVITLNQDATSPVSGFIENLLKLKGLMGELHGSAAVRVTELVSNASKESFSSERKD